MSLFVKVGARASILSQRQVWEVQGEIRKFHPEMEFVPHFVKTRGDKDRTTSLRTLGKDDFFTREIDEMLLKGECRIAIHSAKDLPEPLPKGLSLIALTKGVDPEDVLVLRQGERLKAGMRIGASSFRREEMLKTLCEGLIFFDLRGTIEERLAFLETGSLDGVVIAEAALIRLGKTDLTRMRLGVGAPWQGRLAILARKDDEEMALVFAPLNKRRILYFGIDPSRFVAKGEIVHYPLIETAPREVEDLTLEGHTHLIFTSPRAVRYFTGHMPKCQHIAVGEATAQALRQKGICCDIVAEEESQEGIIAELEKIDLQGAKVLIPGSSRSRPLLAEYLQSRQVEYEIVVLYDTHPKKPDPLPDLEEFDELIFTSPSTVEAFANCFTDLPKRARLTPIGPVTAQALERLLSMTANQ